MTAIKIYLDEDVHTFIAHTLRLRGWEALTTQEAAQREADDVDQIAFATERGYTIVSYNVQDFPRLHYERIASGQMHAGMIVATQDHPRRNLRALFNLLDAPACLRRVLASPSMQRSEAEPAPYATVRPLAQRRSMPSTPHAS